MKNNKPELIAPAGDLEKLKIAFQFGADAVYASTPKFSMRSRGEIKFDDETLKEGIAYAHDLGKKVYLTINVFPHSSEIEEMKEHVLKTLAFNPDAVICADPGIIEFVKNNSSIPIHLSTQANTTNHLTANFWKNQGVKRIVLARELNLKDIKIITDNVEMPDGIETFVHGAMCMAYSGRCQISNYMVGRDPNKGECIQACRFKYKYREIGLEEDLRKDEQFKIIEDDNGSYILNSKDLCMINHIPDLINVGITSFKIEGRLKSIYYLGVITRAYRQAIDLYFENHIKYEENKDLLFEEVSKTSNRGFTTGFYYHKPNEETNNYATSRADGEWGFVGIVKKYDKEKNQAIIEVRNKLESGSDVEIVTPTKIVKYKIVEMIQNNEKIDVAHAGYIITLNILEELVENSFIRIKK